MSLIEAVTAVANEAGYVVPSTIVGSSDVTGKQLLAIANRVVKEMAIAYPWPKLFASGSITLSAGVASYALPASFSWYHYDTFWNSSTRWRLLGPMSPQEYADIRGSGIDPTLFSQFQIRGVTSTELLISPTPQSTDTIIFEYIADRAVRPVTWTTTTTVAAGAYCFYNGNYYSTTAGGTTGVIPPTHTSGSLSDGGVTWTYYAGAYSTFLADTDEPILPQRVLEQGMLERFAEIHGLDSIQPRFLDQLNEEYSKAMPGKILYADGGGMSPLIYGINGVGYFGRGY